MEIQQKALIILGSSRSDGNTRKLVDYINESLQWEVVDLLEKEIAYYDYEYRNQHDDFGDIALKMGEADLILFATPVYWYSMSAPLKTFFDRLSDLVRIKKELGRKLKGKQMAVLSCGSEPLDFDFYIPFKKSAAYLNMHYIGDVHGWMTTTSVSEEVLQKLDAFKEKLNETS